MYLDTCTVSHCDAVLQDVQVEKELLVPINVNRMVCARFPCVPINVNHMVCARFPCLPINVNHMLCARFPCE